MTDRDKDVAARAPKIPKAHELWDNNDARERRGSRSSDHRPQSRISSGRNESDKQNEHAPRNSSFPIQFSIPTQNTSRTGTGTGDGRVGEPKCPPGLGPISKSATEKEPSGLSRQPSINRMSSFLLNTYHLTNR